MKGCAGNCQQGRRPCDCSGASVRVVSKGQEWLARVDVARAEKREQAEHDAAHSVRRWSFKSVVLAQGLKVIRNRLHLRSVDANLAERATEGEPYGLAAAVEGVKQHAEGDERIGFVCVHGSPKKAERSSPSAVAWHVIETTFAAGAKPAPEWRDRLQCPEKRAAALSAAMGKTLAVLVPAVFRALVERRRVVLW